MMTKLMFSCESPKLHSIVPRHHDQWWRHPVPRIDLGGSTQMSISCIKFRCKYIIPAANHPVIFFLECGRFCSKAWSFVWEIKVIKRDHKNSHAKKLGETSALKIELADSCQKMLDIKSYALSAASQVFLGKSSSSNCKGKPEEVSVWAGSWTHLVNVKGSRPPKGHSKAAEM